MTDYKIGNIIKEGLEKNKMTQVELARILNVEKSAVNRWCVNKTVPDAKTILQIADILDLSLDKYLHISHYNDNEKAILDVYARLSSERQKKMFYELIMILDEFKG